MNVQDFVQRVEEHAELSLAYKDDAICIIRCRGPAGERRVRLGLWAVERMYWEQIAEVLGLAAHV